MFGAWVRTFLVQTSWNLRVAQKFVEAYLTFHVPKNCATMVLLLLFEDYNILIYIWQYFTCLSFCGDCYRVNITYVPVSGCVPPIETIAGWWLTYPFEKYESHLGLLFPIYGKIKAMFQTTNQFNRIISAMVFQINQVIVSNQGHWWLNIRILRYHMGETRENRPELSSYIPHQFNK